MPDSSIKDPNYKEWPELNYSKESQYARNIKMFQKSGKILYPSTRTIYEYIRDYCIDFVKNHPQYPKFNWKPKIVDIGCGGGFGSYILSHEADVVWGIDKSESNIRWAKKVYEKHQNGIYYSSQLTFDVIDINTENREIQPFDIIACVEVIEHLDKYENVLKLIKRLCKKDKAGNFLSPPDATAVFISTPNRNFPRIGNEHPKNKRHVREWTPAELKEILDKWFQNVELLNIHGEPQKLDFKDPVMLFKCSTPR